MRRRLPLHGLALVFALGCASGGGVPSPAGPGRARDLITGEQLVATHAASLYDAIRQLRPEFLRPHVSGTITNPQPPLPVVYVDHVSLGGLDALRNFQPTAVYDVRYVNAADATTRYGTGHMGGAIEVRTIAAVHQ